MIKSYLDPKTGIMYAKFKGNIYFNELLDHVTAQETRRHYPRKLKILSDARQGQLQIKPKDFYIIRDQLAETLKQFNVIYDAFMVSNTKDTALSMLYMELIKLDNYYFKVFSTEEAAMHWLMSK